MRSSRLLWKIPLALAATALVSACGGFDSSSSSSEDESNHVDATKNISDYDNITCDGTTADTAGLTAALDEIGSVETQLDIPCPLVIDSNFTFPDNITLSFYGSGSIKAKAGTETLTVNGDLRAGRFKVFNNFAAGNMTFGTDSEVEAVFPEWFGAVGDNATPVDDQVALDSSFKSLASGIGQYVSLQGKFYSASTCNFALPGDETGLVGVNSATSGIYCRSSTASSNILTVAGVSTADTLDGNFVSHVALVSDALVSGRTGLMLQFVDSFNAEDVLSTNNEAGFTFFGAVNSECRRCRYLYSLGGVPGNLFGFFVDGTNPNSYLKIQDSSAISNPASFGTLNGAYITGDHISDLLFENFRTEANQYGVFVNSNSTDDGNIRFVNNIHNNFAFNGYKISNVQRMLSIQGGWVAPATNGVSTAGAALTFSKAIVSGVQFYGTTNAATHTNLSIQFSDNVIITGNLFRDALRNISDNQSSLLTISGNAFSTDNASPGEAHIYFSGTQRSVIGNNSFTGFITAGGSPAAIYLDATTANNKVTGNIWDNTNFTNDTIDASGMNTIEP